MQTKQFVARGEFASAVLVARRLLAMNQNNLAACRAMGEMAEAGGKREAVAWRTQVAHLEPNVPENQLTLAKTALRFRQLDLTENVLKAIPESARASVQFHQISGALALSRHDPAAAETHFAAAVQLAPRDPQMAMNLALLQLASGDNVATEAAHARLVELSAEPIVRLEVLRSLTGFALARSDKPGAQKWAAELRVHERANYADALLYFQAMHGTEAAAPALEELKMKAATSPATTAEFITWLNRQQMAVVAVDWISRLPAEIRDTEPVPLAIAESYSFLHDWMALRRHVEAKNWGSFEAMRLAVESHALHRLRATDRPSMETQATWRAALKAAARRFEQLAAIAQLAEGWGYQAEAEEAWWLVAQNTENARAGLSALQRLYRTTQDTRGLLRVAKRALELNPGDLVAANNCASLGLLLAGDGPARRLAAKLHAEHPTNRAFTATHAYALHTEGRLTEALKLMEGLNEDALRDPAIAAYYVVMLADNGQIDRARSYLANAKRAALLPEEQQLLTAAALKILAGEKAEVAKR